MISTSIFESLIHLQVLPISPGEGLNIDRKASALLSINTYSSLINDLKLISNQILLILLVILVTKFWEKIDLKMRFYQKCWLWKFSYIYD
jgi:hypothetical protein